VATLFIIFAFICLWVVSIESAYKAYCLWDKGKKVPKFKDDVKSLFDSNLHAFLLPLPVLGVVVFTILPLVFMIFMAFTNYSKLGSHTVIFNWVGLKNFAKILNFSDAIGSTFWSVLGWTLVWAVAATFSNYFLGMILAMVINRRGTRAKGMWRAIFMLSAAVPQFVSLLLMRTIFSQNGIVNTLLINNGIIDNAIPFWSNATLARVMVIVINIWIGIPFTVMQVTGILQSIPEEIYEAARVDGAGPVKIFFKITLPYMLFVTAPYLITTFAGNATIDKVTKNALELADFYGLKVPVAKGQERPLVKEPFHAEEFHGETGLGHCVLPETKKELASDNAVLFIRDILNDLPEGEQVTVIETAPMTNLALLLRIFPEVKEKIRQIVFMGGAAKGGNITPAAEFNIYADPEAAKIVFSSGIPLVMCGLDATLKCNLTRNQIMKLCQSGNPVAKACGDMAGYVLGNPTKYRCVASIHDAVPFMYLLHPEFFKTEKALLDVDCSEGAGRGATLCDFRWWLHEEDEMKDIILTDADTGNFQQELFESIYSVSGCRAAK